jgi:ribosomal protein S18 acetylase RimI-like enzyme
VELQVVNFSRELLQAVQAFECGTGNSGTFAAERIKSVPPFPSAIRSMEQHQTEVWLYFLGATATSLQQEILVGFSSLGVVNWPDPHLGGFRRQFGYIPMFAVASMFQGTEHHYSRKIMEDLVTKARERNHRDLCLLVRQDNVRAIRFYEKFAFERIGDAADEKGNFKMQKRLARQGKRGMPADDACNRPLDRSRCVRVPASGIVPPACRPSWPREIP